MLCLGTTYITQHGFATIGELKMAMLDQADWRRRIYVVQASPWSN